MKNRKAKSLKKKSKPKKIKPISLMIYNEAELLKIRRGRQLASFHRAMARTNRLITAWNKLLVKCPKTNEAMDIIEAEINDNIGYINFLLTTMQSPRKSTRTKRKTKSR